MERQASTLAAPRSARPSRSEAAHHAPPFFPKSFGNFAGGAIPIARRAATACGFPPSVPGGPAARMQPGMAGRVRRRTAAQRRRLFAATAAGQRPGGERTGLRFSHSTTQQAKARASASRARQPAIELGDRRPFVEEGPPVLARPAVAPGAQQRDHARLVTREQVQHGRRRRRGGVQRQGVAVDADPNARIARRLQGLDGAHSLALQPAFSGADWSG